MDKRSWPVTSISLQVKRLSNMRKKVSPDTAKFLRMFNDSLAQYGKSIDKEGLEELEATANCDLLTAEIYGRLLGCNILFDNASNKIVGKPTRRMEKLKRAIARHQFELKYLTGIDIDKPPVHRVGIFAKDDTVERGFVSVEMHMQSGDGIEFEHIRLGMMRAIQKRMDADQDELDEMEKHVRASE